MQRSARLAHSTRPGDGDHAVERERVLELTQLRLAAKKARELGGKIRPPAVKRSQWWKS